LYEIRASEGYSYKVDSIHFGGHKAVCNAPSPHIFPKFRVY